MNRYINKLILLCMALLAGCSTTQPTHFYILNTTESADNSQMAVQSPNAMKASIGLGPVSIPRYLDRLQIVSRDASNQLQLAEFHQWAEPLTDTITRELYRSLSARHPELDFYSYPWNAFGEVDYRLVIDFIQFDGGMDDSVWLEARWALIRDENRQIVSDGYQKINQKLEGTGYAAFAMALSRSLELFIIELSKTLPDFDEAH